MVGSAMISIHLSGRFVTATVGAAASASHLSNDVTTGPVGLGRPGPVQGVVDLGPIGDVELGEHLAKVIADSAVADKQLLADLPVRQTIGGQARDLRLPHSQVAARATVARSFSEGLSGGGKLPRRAIGECDCSDRV